MQGIMNNSKVLINNIENLHTTELGIKRIRKNLELPDINVVNFCKNIILGNNCKIWKQGKNWYCKTYNIIITINSYSYTIITAHKT